MEGLEGIGKLLIAGGVVMAIIGGLLVLLSRVPGLERLPGTLRIERPGFTCIVPILGSIILSLLLTIILNLVIRIIRFFTQGGS
jgi:hypothetical protein